MAGVMPMPDWLDSWTNTRRLSQQELAKRWANRGLPIEPLNAPAKILPIEHTKKILLFGKKAYRRWESEGFPEVFTWERIP